MNYLEQEVLQGQINNIEQVGATNELNEMFIVVNQLGVKLKADGNQWCYVYGELPEPDCIAGFGDTPEGALREFYKNWKHLEIKIKGD